ncbi:hypothetical protein J6T93_04850 [bacterium]|nr:hypothetical protein [bacterium]
MRVILLTILLASLSSFGGDNDFVFRFSSNYLSDFFPVGNNLLNFRSCDGSSEWVSVTFSDRYQTAYFEAREAGRFEDRKSVTFTVFYDGSNVFGQTVMEPKTYRFLCQWDEDGPIEEDVEYSASLLYDEEGFYSPGEDRDKWIFEPKCQGYCFEVSAAEDFLLKADQGSFELNEPVALLPGEGSPPFSKRLYVTNAILDRILNFRISRPENSEAKDIRYSFSLKPVRPLVLVHGIRSSPTWHKDPESSFGDLKLKACSYGGFPPCLVFDFPWNSKNGCIKDYCGGKGSEHHLYGFADKACGNWKLKPVFFAHSMGGLLFFEQMKNRGFAKFVDGAIFAGSPFCGSDIANVLLQTTPGWILKEGGDIIDQTRTTDGNLRLLSRGTKSIAERLKNLGAGLPVLFLVGQATENVITGFGDKRVNASSASLFNTLSFLNEDHLILNMEHGELVEIPLPPTKDYEEVCRKIKTMLEH